MPSTIVHVAIAAILACALLGSTFDRRSLALVLAAVAFIDFDVFVGFVILGAHRAAFHTLLWPALGTVLLVYDVRIREESWLRRRFGDDAPRIAAVTIFAVVVAGIGPDLVTNGVNLFWPIHDQFYTISGHAVYSTKKGLVQTFVQKPKPHHHVATTKTRQYRTGVDPTPGKTHSNKKKTPARVFLLVGSGLQLLLVCASVVITSVRLWDAGRNA